MSEPRFRIFAILVALSLLAVSCRAEPSVDLANGIEAQATEAPSTVDTGTVDTGSAEAGTTETGTQESSTAQTDTAQKTDVDRPAGLVAPPQWGEQLALDSRVIEGQLDNGMRYLVRPNGAPGTQAQLRLVVNAGSLNEAPGTEGVAHFLEHMMFNGTERFPDNELIRVLEGFGSGFGADINAYTDYEETVYSLQVPTLGTEALVLAIDVLHQWASAATIAPDAVVAERGVIREEHRRRTEGLSGRLSSEVRETLLADSDYANRDPIGLVEVIDAMTDVDTRAFYERWYVPELMTIVVVGDFDAQFVERQIIDTFSTIPSDGTAEPLPVADAGALPQPIYRVFTDAEINQSEIEVLWRLDAAPVRTRLDIARELTTELMITMLRTRFFEAVQGEGSVRLSSSAFFGSLSQAHNLLSFSGVTDSETLREAMAEIIEQLEQARQHGFSDQEFGRAVEDLRSFLEQQLAESDTRQDADIAADLVSHVLGEQVALSDQDRHDIVLEVLEALTPADAQGRLFDFIDSPPYVLVTAPAADIEGLPTEQDLADSFARSIGSVVGTRDNVSDDRTALMERPAASAVVDTRDIPELSARVVTYENGVQLAMRQTQITENLIQLRAVSRGGNFAVEGPEVPLLGWAASMVAGSGFESVDIVSLNRLLSGSIATLSSSIGRAEESLFGESSTEDLETLMQLVHLQVTEPTISDLEVRQFDEAWRPLAENPASNPPFAADLELWRLRYGDSPWFRLLPTIADLDALDRELLLGAYQDRFADAGDFVFVVVGDFDPDEVIALGASYLGTLPDNGVREGQIDRDPGIPEENLVGTVRAGIGDQGRVRINWESPYPFTIEAEVAAQALEIVVNSRLLEVLREELGASYSPNASVSLLSEPKPWIDTIIEVESDPARIDEVSTVIRQELDRLRAGDIENRYLQSAVDQLAEDYRFFSNQQWSDLISFHILNPQRPAGEFADRTAIAQALTIDDLVAAAQAAFPPQRSVEVRLLPAN